MKSDQPAQGDISRQSKKYSTEFYEIIVQGLLDSVWEQWFEGMSLSQAENGESGAACTLISGPVTDQAALHGLLIKIRDLNLKLITVRKISQPTNTCEEIPIDLT